MNSEIRNLEEIIKKLEEVAKRLKGHLAGVKAAKRKAKNKLALKQKTAASISGASSTSKSKAGSTKSKLLVLETMKPGQSFVEFKTNVIKSFEDKGLLSPTPEPGKAQ